MRNLRNLRKNDGFTLIELMIVVVIIGILAAIAIPKFTQVSNGAKQAEAEPILKQICSLAESEKLKDGNWPADLTAITGWEDPGAKYFTTWAFDGTTGIADAQLNAGITGLKLPSMDCATRQLTLS
jgi:prepilin-type N-terminal cleavage/methylation domain-containing protein